MHNSLNYEFQISDIVLIGKRVLLYLRHDVMAGTVLYGASLVKTQT